MINREDKIIKRLNVIVGLLLEIVQKNNKELTDRDKIETLYKHKFGVGETGEILGKDPTKISKQLYFVKRKKVK